MNRREFLRAAGIVGGAAILGGPGVLACSGGSSSNGPSATNVPRLPLPPDSVLAHPAAECPIDTIVVLMMENRSFDHYLGWLGDDAQYREEGRRLHGPDFHIDASVKQLYRNPFGVVVETRSSAELSDDPSPYRGCNHRDPGHSWTKGRVQRDEGFLASGSGNDAFAASYYVEENIPVHAHIARRFTVMDRHHAALLGPTWPNRQYLYSAQSEGLKNSLHPLDFAQYSSPTILEKLDSAGVAAAEYFTNLPVALLWGSRMFKFVRTLDVFFSDAAAGTLPNVSFITPWFGGPFRTDDHPHGDIVLGQRYIEALYTAFVRSPQWQRGMFVLAYDEWGGFFDHVHPPVVPDPRSSGDDLDNFGQLGFRVPSMVASPYARPGYVDHNLYDHTSILRFLEWRFLGAPAQGPDRNGNRWFLTERDRYANNYGASLQFDEPDPEVDLQELSLEAVAPDCDKEDQLEKVGENNTPRHGFEPTETLDALVRQRYSDVSFTPWLRETDVRNVPVLPDDRPR